MRKRNGDMSNIEWLLLGVGINLLLGAIYLGVRIGEFRLRKSFLKAVFQPQPGAELEPEDYEGDNWAKRDETDIDPLN
jgi:hypothetical protein